MLIFFGGLSAFGELASISLKNSRNYEKLLKAKELAEEKEKELRAYNEELSTTTDALKESYDELEKSKENIALKNKISNSIILGNKEEFFQKILELVLEIIKCDFGYFGYIDNTHEKVLVCPSMTYKIWDMCKMQDKAIEFPQKVWAGIWGESLMQKKSIFKNTDLILPEGHVQLKNALAVPIMFDKKLIGQIVVADKREGFCLENQNLLESICNYISPLLKSKLKEDGYLKEIVSANEKAEENELKL